MPHGLAFRRTELSLSLVNPNNGYSQLRLSHYASGDANDWDRLPEWNPATEPIQAAELDAPGGASTTSLSERATPHPEGNRLLHRDACLAGDTPPGRQKLVP